MEIQGRRIKIIAPVKRYSISFKKQVVKEYERGSLNKDQLQRKYGIKGNSCLLEWCRRYGKLAYPERLLPTGRPMKDPQKQRIKELEKALELVRLKIEAYEQLIDITEKREGIAILKKDGTRQSKSLGKSEEQA